MRQYPSLFSGRTGIRLLAATVIPLLGFGLTPAQAGPSTLASQSSAVSPDRTTLNLKVFDRVWDLVNLRYYDAKFHGVDWAAAAATYRPMAAAAVDDHALYKTIKTMLDLLKDGHTEIMTKTDSRQLLTGKAIDVGLAIRTLENRAVVERVVPGTPADSTGVRPGWILLTLNGQPLSDWKDRFDPAVGEIMQFGFLDAYDHPVSLSLPFRTMVPKPESRDLPGGAIYLRFDRFTKSNYMWLFEELPDVKDAAKAPALVIDLRDNLGGEIFFAGAALGDFFEHAIDYGKETTRTNRASDLRTYHFLSARYKGRLAILVGPYTASSAEIFAAVMQQQHRAIVVGRPTAAAVLSAEVDVLPDGSRLEVSTADYTLPGGRRLDGQGVKPDVSAPPRTLADLRSGRDPDLEAALHALDLPAFSPPSS